ncbi:hypothetical protein PB01_15120 [Psychrobacillus glaciei]|uniref:DUF2268 domain-containing protein n=1 Tax=Psychrobacillus glaciei TaxID=2283160 RepID=A0A5J6SPY8_9BACI|nr:DUF2268 domain-containing putative Zn-dependent protease [Psychrobacillus glaciei]QFG00049.1 hypothetical protein PB01_15120 [Psychrobacillus glaciei]
MSVIDTKNLLHKFVEVCEEKSGKSLSYMQCETICEPLMEFFPKINPEVLQYELLTQGLFEPDEWIHVKNNVKEMEEQNVWRTVEKEYKYLRKLWKGPKVSIYIFPIKKANLKSGEQIPRKNGIAYRNVLFLFLSTKITIEEIRALLAHEYNHVCRLKFLDLVPDKISLKDSLIIEGLGEYAVKELHGEEMLAPWTKKYSYDEALYFWNKHFVPSLNVLGTKNHHLFLFGKERSRFPRWIGYHLGFQIVNSFQEKQGPFHNGELYIKSADEIIAGSNYPII